jgi:diamine N-acetyltransferase
MGNNNMVTLKEIDKENFWDIIKLEVEDYQKEYVLENSVSIAQSKIYPECIPKAIYSDDTLVGFLMYDIDREYDNYWIDELMIDKKYQKKGYGKKAVEIIIAEMKKDANHNKIYLHIEKGNINAVKLYESFGFKMNGKKRDGCDLMELEY